MKYQFHLPGRETAKGKSLTVICMVAIIVSLYAMSYFLFLRTIDVDVTKDASITYRGETGSASVKVKNETKNYNQRIQEFMDSIYYEVTPQEGLSNGDTITIQAFYDKELARRYNIHPINVTRKISVKKLPIRFDDASQIPPAYLKTMTQQGKTYLKNNMAAILNEDFTSFSVDGDVQLQESELVYRTFLDARTNDGKDKVIDVYAIQAKGDVKTSNEGEETEQKSETIFYMITYNEINTSLKILDENVYGEKIITASGYDLTKAEDFERYMNAKYATTYALTFMNIEEDE